MKKNHLKNEWKEFLKSFKPKIEFAQVIFFDILYFVLAWLSLIIFARITQNLLLTLSQLNLQQSTDINLIESQTEIFTNTLSSLAIYVIGLLIVLFIICIIIRSLIWNAILNKKITWGYIGQFALLNLIWLIWIIPFLFLLSIQNYYWMAGLTSLLGIIFIYFTMILYTMFTKYQKIGKSLKMCFKLGVMKIRWFLLPALFIILTFFAISLILSFIGNVIALAIIAILFILFLLIFAAWIRIYCSEVVLRVEKK